MCAHPFTLCALANTCSLYYVLVICLPLFVSLKWCHAQPLELYRSSAKLASIFADGNVAGPVEAAEGRVLLTEEDHGLRTLQVIYTFP